jgi:hypothetical protein
MSTNLVKHKHFLEMTGDDFVEILDVPVPEGRRRLSFFKRVLKALSRFCGS